ncbi:MAG: hypothetical protein M3P87_07360 [Actinomycetota bacterium]|nr:hypothetical protein [Actinomycetota bacterium]
MLKWVLAAALAVTACTGGTNAATTTTAEVSVTIPDPTTTTSLPLPIQIDDCSTPPVPFSPLCEA